MGQKSLSQEKFKNVEYRVQGFLWMENYHGWPKAVATRSVMAGPAMSVGRS
jgi:hypothetical protein